MISADALWQNGFGVVFPELEGVAAFDEVSETLDLIEVLAPQTVIPGHGPVFQDIPEALVRARTRLDQFTRTPDKHHRHAMKVLIKFRLLEWQQIELSALRSWAQETPYLAQVMPAAPAESSQWMLELLQELAGNGAIELKDDWVINH